MYAHYTGAMLGLQLKNRKEKNKMMFCFVLGFAFFIFLRTIDEGRSDWL